MPSAARQVYPHLPSGERPLVQTQQGPGLADALHPGPKPPTNWHREGIALIQHSIRQGRTDAEIARRYGLSKQVVGQIRKLGR
jgi:hypothetical protein